ncbi:protein translocase subunit SecD [Croceicoccus sp. F390]|uniref:Protein translocase subunit SecD n=1 Tax=Croceicoccus esteveae TaxID=3075597 RepID=A0ABU2ZKG4_9SPHN|nr:protein translocase subunit SecD [Croceicoccus sp. F390]MDT0576543.1 protein translocase subunit SecD [Croceicoccus sp. F390]
MLDFPRWKVIWLITITVLGVFFALPSLVSLAGGNWPNWLPDPEVNLGLDLAGGSHILLEADVEQVRAQRLESMEEDVRRVLRDTSPQVQTGEISRSAGRLTFMVEDSGQIDAAREALLPLTEGVGLTGQRDWTIRVADGTRIILAPTDQGLEQSIELAMDTATDVVRRRIDELGTREPTIIRQGSDRIVVQVPGLRDPQALKDLLGQTAKLEFKLVDQSAAPSDLTQGIAPPGSQLLNFAPGANQQGQIAVKRLGGIQGDQLTDARQGYDQNGAPVVNITFNQEGGRRFAQLTTQNVNKPFAIILDGEALSAPNINEPILGGTAQISGGFTVETANALAISLRSGALPVDLQVVEERTVGPDLGADSIRKGMLALIVGGAAVMAFMVVTYGRFGVYANFAIVLNVLMIFGIMAVLGSTLTLPGIAGFVLTIGTAVDANVLINERIREERRRNRRVLQSVEVGYREARRAIFDANITNVIAGVLLFLFGSGPVRGFAIVLIIGIVTSVFTAVTLSRMWVARYLRKRRPAELQI